MVQVKIASWNVNSINARLDNLLFWLVSAKPDVALLQEIKCEEGKFPFEAIEDLGYNIEMLGQKSYNGVAILSKFPLQDVVRNLDESDSQARYIEAVVCCPSEAIRVASIYVPNGGAQLLPGQKVNESDKFIYKMGFFDRLFCRLNELLKHNEIAIFGGDYNVAVGDIDVYDPVVLKDTICCHIDEKKKFRQLLNLGYQDSFRIVNPAVQNFSWWDYRGNAWKYNKGMRIDYLLTSPRATDYLSSAFMMDNEMMQRIKPSDHCPILIDINIVTY